MQAVRFDQYGDVDVLYVDDVDQPTATAGRLLVRVDFAGTNPGEIAIREGALDEQFPATFPSGQGSDFTGAVVDLGDGVDGPAVGTDVVGWSDERSSQAEYVAVPADQVAVRPVSLAPEVAGALSVVAKTAVACVRAVAPQPNETVLVAGASGGVGFLTS